MLFKEYEFSFLECQKGRLLKSILRVSLSPFLTVIRLTSDVLPFIKQHHRLALTSILTVCTEDNNNMFDVGTRSKYM